MAWAAFAIVLLTDALYLGLTIGQPERSPDVRRWSTRLSLRVLQQQLDRFERQRLPPRLLMLP
jgi:hypothetical protein